VLECNSAVQHDNMTEREWLLASLFPGSRQSLFTHSLTHSLTPEEHEPLLLVAPSPPHTQPALFPLRPAALRLPLGCAVLQPRARAAVTPSLTHSHTLLLLLHHHSHPLPPLVQSAAAPPRVRGSAPRRNQNCQ
jgi:hypothetical protein